MKLCCDCGKVELPTGAAKRCPACRKLKNMAYDRNRKSKHHRNEHARQDKGAMIANAKCPRCKNLHPILVKRIPTSTIYQYCKLCGILSSSYAGSGMVG
jgi:phage FluMu protein Com